jgi:hypothetical protein
VTEAPFHFRFDRAVTKSDLPMSVRHLLMVINIKTDRFGRIPDEFQPSYTELAASMGASTRGVKKWVAVAEDAGWLIVTRPSTYASQTEHARNKYQPVLPSRASEPGSPGDAMDPLGHHPVNEVHLPGESDAPDLVNDVHTIQHTSDHSHSATQPPPIGGADDAAVDLLDQVRDSVEDIVGGFFGDEESALLGMFEHYDNGRRKPAVLVTVLANAITKRRGRS